ncbi:MAG: hypothetical protein HUU20_07050 [Pirellulales bacterium]|nr:hypothetical protein [Pirellulales bacterium]
MAARRRLIHLPLKRTFIAGVGKFAYRFVFTLDVRSPEGEFTEIPFRLDTGTDFMTIPQWMARAEGIPFRKDCPVQPMTAAGRAAKVSYISPVYFSFPQLPEWQFKADCIFSPYTLRYGLFSLTDFVPHFAVRSNKAGVRFPEGSVVFQLRADHGGTPRV